MIKKIHNTLLVMAFIPLLAVSALELNTVPSVSIGDNNTENPTEEVITDGYNLSEVEKDRLEKALKINTYFHERNMPLFGHGMQFVLVAEKYGLPYELLPAIAIRESSGGKYYINNNPFGWGSAKIPFSDFDESIEVVGKNLGGANPRTARYYATSDVKKKLYYYNGTVIKGYEDQVISIMNKIDKTSIDIDVELASK